MTYVSWNDSFSVNIVSIDDQHKKLFGLLNSLYEGMKLKESNVAIKKIVHELSEYTIYHFGVEEKYFDEFNYEFAAIHKAEHKGFVAKIVDFQNRLDKGDVSLTSDILEFLVDWLFSHINGSDKQYSKCFNDNGLT